MKGKSSCINRLLAVASAVALFQTVTARQQQSQQPIVPSQRKSAGLWPLPSLHTNGSTTLQVDTSAFALHVNSGLTPTLKAGIKRYTNLLFIHGTRSRGNRTAAPAGAPSAPLSFSGCTVDVKSTTETLTWGMDESYTLDLQASGRCTIRAATFVGALYAFETLSQLVLCDLATAPAARFAAAAAAAAGAPLPNTAAAAPRYYVLDAPWHVEDAPRFQYRGLMIDSSRHFLPVNAIKRQVDALAYTKMNALHWHLTDAQSTPFDSKTYPKLKQGAFTPSAVYTPDDITEVVEYARLRGVQVLMEIDMPGHSFSFGIGYPELIVNCSSMYPLETEFWCSSLNVARGASLYSWLEGLLKELVALLPNALFHLGGDEVQYQCWESDPEMVAYLKSRKMTGVELYREFEHTMFGILNKLGKSPVTWDSTFFTNVTLPPGAVVHQYREGSAGTTAIVRAGHKVIVSALNGDYVALQSTWQQIFAEEIMPAGLTAAEEALVLGGAAASWGETTDDSDIDTIVWPDTAAVGERLWSQPGSAANPAAYDANAAALRMIPHRCRLYQRGIRAKPLDDRDGFGRRRLQQQCEVTLPELVAGSLPPLSALWD